MSRFFIHRPIFAAVISIVITLAGLVAAYVLPIAQYPEIAPPTVTITATYPGASAETLARSVAAPIEEQLSGIDDLLYFSSNSSSSNGTLTITATFEVGTDADQATINVNNRVQRAMPRLPDEVRRTGVIVQKRSQDILLVATFVSDDARYDRLYLSNYLTINVLDVLRRVPGVADATIFGARDYAMRIWLRPDRMAQLGITTTDVANAVRGQNQQYAAGRIGQEPAPEGQVLSYTVTAQGRLLEPEQFGDIILRASGPSGVLRLRDVARVELGAQSYDASTTVNGRPAVGVGVYLQSGANALEVADAVRATLDELRSSFPAGVEYFVPFDTTRFVEASIEEVIKTLAEAALLVVLVVFLFLQRWRATLIPMVAVPVSLVGTFAGLYALGFSINTLTLFAMVLAIGIVVDDAIVVVENVERLMSQEGLAPREAAVRSMREVSGALVAIVLVLCAVFIPVAFLGGIAGRLYQQFAVTISIAVSLSGIVALTLSPALCALLLKPHQGEPRLFRPFNRGFGWTTQRYLDGVRLALAHPLAAAAAFLAVLAACVLLLRAVPTAFVPPEDQGYLLGSIQLPDGATLRRTQDAGAAVQKTLSSHPAVENVFVIAGFDLIGGGNRTNAATLFITLKPWSERAASSEALTGYVLQQGAMQRAGLVLAFNPPPIRGLGTAGGFELYIQDRSGSDPRALAQVVGRVTDALRQRSELTGINTFFRPTVPQIHVEVDREKALALGVPLEQVFDALQGTVGSLYVNDFNRSGRTFRVQLQAEAAFRADPEDLGEVYVRSATSNEMLPLKSLIRVERVVGPEQLARYNGFLAARILGSAAPGISSGEAIAAAEEAAAQALPPGYAHAWTGQAFQEKRVGQTSLFAFGFALVMVFLILAAQYERWSLPIAVLLAVPFAVAGALLAVLLRGMNNDIYFQIGLVTLIALAARNAILLVEFAAQRQREGMSPRDAALQAARLRFRPIVMTSAAFILGVLPLALASGAGAAARQSMGTGVLGGMLAATLIATLFVPMFFAVLAGGWRRTGAHARRSDPGTAQTRETS